MAGAAAPLTMAMAQAALPPLPFAPGPDPSQRRLLAWMPGEVVCGGQAVAATAMRRPWTVLAGAVQEKEQGQATYRFRIDGMGRALSIEREGNRYMMGTEDIGPSLAATRFAAGTPKSQCTITYTARYTPLRESPVEDLISYTLTPLSGPLPREGWERISSADSACLAAPRPMPLIRSFPDFRALPGTPGVKDWSTVDYDQNGEGRPINVRVTHGTGNAALDAAATKAVRASKFTGGARKGCMYPYWRAPEILGAPPLPPPEDDALRQAGSNCSSDHGWATRPALVYPEAYRRRSVEGWAIVAFDVAPWGETGNVRVLASEPAADFGEQAVWLLRSARKAASPTGRSGCVERIRFVMGKRDEMLTDEASRVY